MKFLIIRTFALGQNELSTHLNNMKHTLKFTTKEVFELVEVVKSAMEHNTDKDLKSAYRKLNKVEVPQVEHDYNYNLPIWSPNK